MQGLQTCSPGGNELEANNPFKISITLPTRPHASLQSDNSGAGQKCLGNQYNGLVSKKKTIEIDIQIAKILVHEIYDYYIYAFQKNKVHQVYAKSIRIRKR